WVVQQPTMHVGLEEAGADESPQAVQPGRARSRIVTDQLHKPPTHGRRVSFREQSLGGLAEIEIWAGEPSQQLFSAFTFEVEAWRARRIPVAHPIEPSTQPIDPLGIAVGVLVAVITIVP